MSEKGKRNANVVAIVVTWLSIIGAAAGAILTQITDLGVEVPTVVLSILSVLSLLARRIPQVPVDSPRGSSLAIGLLVAVLAMAGVVPDNTSTGPSGATADPTNHKVEDVIEPADCGQGCPFDEAEEGVGEGVPLALYPAIGARLALAMFIPVACNPVTPGIKVAADKVTDGYTGYVRTDPLLSDQQKAERHELACNLRRLVGISVPADCPPVGGEE